jgi:lipopolysaccharide cholinephosphotransferase
MRNKLQSNIFYIAKKVDEICREHKINYYIIGGTALGAFRHKGFIPWDDDFDIALFPSDYEKLISILIKELDPSIFYIERERTISWPFPYSKVKLNGSKFIEKNHIKGSHQGIYIDIFRLTFTKRKFLSRILDFVMAKIILTKALKIRGYTNASPLKKILIFIFSIITPDYFDDYFFKTIKNRKFNKDYVISFLFSNSKFKNSFFDTSVFGQPISLSFENYNFLAPSKIQEYLLTYFGHGYNSIPKLNDRTNHNPLLVRTKKL